MERSRAEAAKYWDKACDVKHDRACHMISEMYHYGVGIPKDMVRAKKIRMASCDRGHADSCHALGVAYLTGTNGGESRDPSKALEPLSRACERGHDGACHNVGSLSTLTFFSFTDFSFFFSSSPLCIEKVTVLNRAIHCLKSLLVLRRP